MTVRKTGADENNYNVSFRKRFFALIIDFTIINFFEYLLNLLLSATLFKKYYINHVNAEPGSNAFDLYLSLSYYVIIVIGFIYFMSCWVFKARSIGEWLLKIKILSKNQPVLFKNIDIVKRVLVYCLIMVPYSIGWSWVLPIPTYQSFLQRLYGYIISDPFEIFFLPILGSALSIIASIIFNRTKIVEGKNTSLIDRLSSTLTIYVKR